MISSERKKNRSIDWLRLAGDKFALISSKQCVFESNSTSHFSLFSDHFLNIHCEHNCLLENCQINYRIDISFGFISGSFFIRKFDWNRVHRFNINELIGPRRQRINRRKYAKKTNEKYQSFSALFICQSIIAARCLRNACGFIFYFRYFFVRIETDNRDLLSNKR